MDMWQGYISSVATHAPLAEIVFDRFHIERYLTQAIEESVGRSSSAAAASTATRCAARSGCC
jgi:transposase